MNRSWLAIVFLLCFAGTIFSQDSDYHTLRTFMSAQMYGEAYNELMQRELSGLMLDSKLRSLKIDLLDRTNLKLQKQAKSSPDDPTIFTILADIAFQKGDYDRASMYISTAISNNGKAISNYVFAKILFRKGNISQAFDQMSKVLEVMPDSLIVFNDFQFLYNCKQYGVATAKKITKDCTFLMRSTPIAFDGDGVEVPESPFANDPTESENSPDFSDFNTVSKNNSSDNGDYSEEDENLGEDLSELSKIDISLESEKEEVKKPSVKEPDIKENKKDDDSNFDIDDSDFNFDEIDNKPVPPKIEKVEKVEKIEKDIVTDNTVDEKDPELEKLAEADGLFKSAKAKFKSGNYNNALMNLEDLNKINPNYPGKEDLKIKIEYELNLEKKYKEAIEILKNNNDYSEYNKAIQYLKEAYNHNTKKFKEAPFYLGDAYSSKDDPDYDQALKYYNIVVDDPDLNSEYRRDIKWRKFEIFMAQDKIDEAKEEYDYFAENEKEYLKSHGNWKLRYIFLWHSYSIIIILLFSIIIVSVFMVFVLQFLPDLASISGKPLDNSLKAFNVGNYNKAIKIAEKALQTKQPIQLDRQLREILVQSYYELGKYEECIDHAKKILVGFPTNNIAWGYIAKASIEIQDTSNEAIKMYEDMYRNDPSRKELLPMLAHHYAKNQDTTPAAMEVLQDCHNMNPEDTEVLIALADGFVRNRTMDKEIIPVLNDAIKIKDKIEFRELLARSFSKCGMYEEAARECVNVLNKDINNVGIHVVYTSSMKKLKKVSKAISQYKEFINENPSNKQLVEILDGLKKEEGDTSTAVDEIPSIFDSLGMPGMEEEKEDKVEEQSSSDSSSTPLPDFLSESKDFMNNTEPQTNTLPEGIQTLNPFAEDDPLFDGFDTDELPEELGGTSREPVEASKSLDNLIDDFNKSHPSDSTSNALPDIEDIGNTPPLIRSTSTNTSTTPSFAVAQKIEECRSLASSKKWDKIIELLSPDFASARNKEMGMLLIDAWLGNNKPEMALEIIQTLDFDPEMLTEDIKEVMYRTASALESNKNYKEALRLYDTICNSDINYKDAFDKSDRLYMKMKG